MIAFRGHFDGKVIVPDEPLDLARNEPLIVRIEPARQPAPSVSAPKTGGSFLEWAARNSLPDDAGLPPDLSENLDHYLYGTPKRSGE